MNIVAAQVPEPFYRCPKDGSVTQLVCCPQCGDVLGVSDEQV